MECEERFNTNGHPQTHPHTEKQGQTNHSRTPNRAATKFLQLNRSTSALVDHVPAIAAHQTNDNRPWTQDVGDVISLLYPRSVETLAKQKQCSVRQGRSKDAGQQGDSALDLVSLSEVARLLLVFGRRDILRKFGVSCEDEDEGSGCTKRAETKGQYPRRDTRGSEDQDDDGLGDGVAEG